MQKDEPNEKIKVIQFIHGLTVGGAETLVKNYCLLFDKKVIDVVLICMKNHKSIYDNAIKHAGIRVIYIYDIIDKYVPGPSIIKKIIHRLLAPFVLRYYMHKENPDIIHSHLFLNQYLKYSTPKTAKLYLTVHSEPEKLWNKSYFRQRDLKAVKWLVKHRKLRFIALHDEMKQKINNIFNVDNTVVINNGINILEYSNAGKKEELREKYKIEPGTLIIGHVGRFSIIKNQSFLIDIFLELLKKNKKSILWMIGVGEKQEDIKDKVKEYGIDNKVVFWNTREDIPCLLKMMDIFVMPSFFEGLSVALIEAQVAGIPSIVSKNIVRESAISNLVHFYSLDNSAEKWANKILEIINNKEKITYTNLDDWSMSKIVKQLERLYYLDLRNNKYCDEYDN